jgi:hypothetical protein
VDECLGQTDTVPLACMFLPACLFISVWSMVNGYEEHEMWGCVPRGREGKKKIWIHGSWALGCEIEEKMGCMEKGMDMDMGCWCAKSSTLLLLLWGDGRTRFNENGEH